MELLWDTSCVWGTCMLGLWLKKASWLRGRETFLDVEESLLWIHTIKQRGQQNPHDKHAVNTAEEQVLLQKQKPIRRQADSLNSRAELNPMQKLTCLDHNPRKKDFYQMCLNKSLLLFLTCVKGKIYFAPERKKILQFLLNSPVNQEEPETSAWWPIAFILFAKLKGGLRFFWGRLCLCKAAGPALNVGHTMQGHFEEAGWHLLRSQSGLYAQEPLPPCRMDVHHGIKCIPLRCSSRAAQAPTSQGLTLLGSRFQSILI